ncbi:rhodanese-like domain-containing protein [Edaphobacter sp. 4G125]|nr:rhodanese-like domain-containing protein [Edaphobacter sp. 4G125]
MVIVLAAIGLVIWRIRSSRLRELDGHSIDAQTLHDLLLPEPRVLLFDVRQPLDLLAYSEKIPGAVRLAPKDVMSNPALIPQDRDVVVYCTCPGDKTSREIIQRGLALGLRRVKLLYGGLDAWKQKGYPVEPYKESFRLDTAV